MKSETRKIEVVESILSVNEIQANENRARLDNAGITAFNFMASPGAGKTSLIEHTIRGLHGFFRIAYVDGDVATSIDADRATAAGATSIQINTGGGCHLDAVMLKNALDQFDLDNFDLLIVENVGNLICPINFQLGTHKNVLIASLPEGDDKPYKYPGMYQGVDILIINKIDLSSYVTFDMSYFRQGVEILNPGLVTFPLSCQTGEGIDAWLDWMSDYLELTNGP